MIIYARLKKMHPAIANAFNIGLLGVERTTKPFSTNAFDLTFELTYNADAGGRLTGISHMTNNAGVRERWARSHSFRSEIISHLLDHLGKAAHNNDVTSFLLNAVEKGLYLKNELIEKCSEDHFESSMKQNPVKKLAKFNVKKNIKLKYKIVEVQIQCDLFRRLIGISMEADADIEKLLSYPLTPVSLS